MKMMKKLMITVPCLLTIATSVHAENLEEKKFWEKQMNYMNQSLKTASEYCGTNFTFEFVGKDQLRSEAAKNHNSPNGICDNVVDEVLLICKNDGADGKAAVKAKITGFACGYANPRSLDMKGGIVTYLGNNQQPNFSDWAKPWLMKHL